jgi:hypothetical protein
VKDRVTAGLGFLAPVVQNLASALSTGGTLVQIGEQPPSDEHETRATRRALHVWREWVDPHRRLCHLFTLSPRTSRGTPGSIAHRNSQRGGLGDGLQEDARHRLGNYDPCVTTGNTLLA